MKTITLQERTIGFIGDPHLGLSFQTGVPLHRRGEREAAQFAQFRDELDAEVDMNICLGDIFNSYVVAPEIVLKVAIAYRDAAIRRPKTWFVLVRGNHDASRDSDKASSFDLLYELLDSMPNIVVVKDELTVIEHGILRVGVLPWHPFRNSKEMARELGNEGYREYDLVVGHWDRVTFDENPHNAIPLFELRPYTKVVVSGHDHRPYDEMIDGVRVLFPGSLQPYAHGEDPEGNVYVTLTLDELKEALAASPGRFHDMAVRVALRPGEQIDFEVDAWAVTTKPIADNGEDFVDISMQTESFDMMDILGRCLTKHGVSGEVGSEVLGRYQEMRNA
jgi:predicted phosphodiesterase